jgi:hypothetical protein
LDNISLFKKADVPKSKHFRRGTIMDSRLVERILKAPNSESIIPGSTPVISFGDFTKAKIATVGINPSSKEFRSGNKLLALGKKRLVDKQSLGLTTSQILTTEHAGKVWDGCKNYFSALGNPYSWFDPLEKLLMEIGFSYKNGTSCHIDVVQWATFPAWGALDPVLRGKLISDDYDFFKYQVGSPNLKALLVNGATSKSQLESTRGFFLKGDSSFTFVSGSKKRQMEFFTGVGPNEKLVYGWNWSLKALRVSPDERSRIYSELGRWLSDRFSENSQP